MRLKRFKLKLKLRMKDEVELKAEVGAYREKMEEMQMHLKMMEGMVEDTERRFESELFEERRIRRELEEKMKEMQEKDDLTNDRELKTRELMLREREFELAKKKMDRDADAFDEEEREFESAHSISDPAADVICELSMLRSLDDKLRNVKSSVTTIPALLDRALTDHEELRAIVNNVNGYSGRFVMQRFKVKFQSLFKISKALLSVVSILVMAKINRTIKNQSCHQVCSF